MNFMIEDNINVNQLQCASTQIGNAISWNSNLTVNVLEISSDNFQEIISVSILPWNMNIFQLISLRNTVDSYKTVSVYYTNDIIENYLSDINSISMDISSVIQLSNAIYGLNGDCCDMMKLSSISMYTNEDDKDDKDGGDENMDSFTNYEGESDINILLVDSMKNEQEIGYSECDNTDQSFAVLQYSSF